MTNYGIFALDTFRLKVIVMERRTRTVKSLAGAFVEAIAANGQIGVAGAVDLTGAASGEIRVAFGAGALAVGEWDLHVRATIGTETQTVHRSSITVDPAPVVAP